MTCACYVFQSTFTDFVNMNATTTDAFQTIFNFILFEPELSTSRNGDEFAFSNVTPHSTKYYGVKTKTNWPFPLAGMQSAPFVIAIAAISNGKS